MEWANILSGIIMALLFAIGVPLALRKRKKSGPQNVEQLLNHLREVGVKVSWLESSVEEAKIGVGRASSQRSEGIIQVEGRNIDYINVVSVTSQYGTQFFLDHLVRTPSWSGKKRRKKTRMVRKKSSGMWGKVVGIEWKGDDYLARELNFDYQLKDKLLLAEVDELKSGIQIFPKAKHEYSRVRISYLLPSSDLFEAIDIISRYIKSGW